MTGCAPVSGSGLLAAQAQGANITFALRFTPVYYGVGVLKRIN